MKYNPEKHHRRSIRLKEYDYSQAGGYYITICSYSGKCIFGDIVNDQMILKELGKIVRNEWLKTERIRENVELDAFMVMPNHFHGIIILTDNGRSFKELDIVGAYGDTPLQSPSKTIGAIVRGFKSATTKQINQFRNAPGLSVWQRNYYEHIIRNENDLNRIREYIINNPLKWELDDENPN